jgi:hypothetical protein
MVRDSEGRTVELVTLDKVEEHGESFSITRSDGWSFGLSKRDLKGYVPQAGDWAVFVGDIGRPVAGVIVNGHTVFMKSQADMDAEHAQWVKNLRLERLEEFVKNGPALEKRIDALPAPLRARMYRFKAKDGPEKWMEFLIDGAGYEMYALEGAAALLRKVQSLALIEDANEPAANPTAAAMAIDWINDWWNINSDKHDPPYDYAKQMAEVPDFGEGHSGNTAGAAKMLAVKALEGADL